MDCQEYIGGTSLSKHSLIACELFAEVFLKRLRFSLINRLFWSLKPILTEMFNTNGIGTEKYGVFLPESQSFRFFAHSGHFYQ